MEPVWNDLTLSPHPTATAAAALAAEPQLSVLARHEFSSFLGYKGTLSKAQSDEYDHQRIISQPESLQTNDFLKSKPGSSCACPNGKRDITCNENFGDIKKKRLMNNRESAARSRARKQAYTYELEAEVAHLRKENAMLRKQHEKLIVECGGDQKRQKLCRTLTAPF